MEKLGPLLDALLGSPILRLGVLSCEKIFHGAGPAANREHLDDYEFNLWCRAEKRYSNGKEIKVGSRPENLYDLDFSLTIRSAEAAFWRIYANNDAAIADQDTWKDSVGFLHYHPPISKIGSDDIEQGKKGSVEGGMFFGIETCRDIAHSLATAPDDVKIWITVGASQTGDKHSLTYDVKDSHLIAYCWDESNTLQIKEARVGIGKSVWEAQEEKELQKARAWLEGNETEEDNEPSTNSLLSILIDKMDRLNTSARRVGYFIAAGFIAILAVLLFVR